MKKLLNIKGIETLSKKKQRNIFGGRPCNSNADCPINTYCDSICQITLNEDIIK